jgi:hypothetical protein
MEHAPPYQPASKPRESAHRQLLLLHRLNPQPNGPCWPKTNIHSVSKMTGPIILCGTTVCTKRHATALVGLAPKNAHGRHYDHLPSDPSQEPSALGGAGCVQADPCLLANGLNLFIRQILVAPAALTGPGATESPFCERPLHGSVRFIKLHKSIQFGCRVRIQINGCIRMGTEDGSRTVR